MEKYKAYRSRHREHIRTLQVAWRKSNRHKSKAHYAVAKALKSGLLKKPENCEQCGGRTSRLHAHHSDYSKPLEVLWLCVSCHAKLHGKNGVCVGLVKLFVRGEAHGRAKLNRTQVDEIKEQAASGIAKRQIGRQYGVSEKLIRLICKGEIWANV
jgi:hypothetical protein